MNYNNAITAVNDGKYAWRPEWNGAYIYLYNGEIYRGSSQGPAQPYAPTPADEAATDFDTGDHPPHP